MFVLQGAIRGENGVLEQKLRNLESVANEILEGKKNAIEITVEDDRINTIKGYDAKYYCCGIKTVLSVLRVEGVYSE